MNWKRLLQGIALSSLILQAGYSQGDSFFDGIEGVQESQEQAPLIGQGAEDLQTVEINTDFWLTNFSTIHRVPEMEAQFPPAVYPEKVDLQIQFDSRVVQSFSDYMITQKIPMVYDMMYDLTEDDFRVSIMLDYDEIDKLDAISGLVELRGAAERKAVGDKGILAIDGVFKIYNQEGKENSVLLAFDEIETYRFWRDGENSASPGDSKNLELFRRYIRTGGESSGEEVDVEALEQELEALEQAPEDQKDYRKMFELQKRIQEAQSSNNEFQLVKDRFNTQINLTPKFMSALIEYLSKMNVFNKYLELSHHSIESGSEGSSVTQLIQVDRLDKALQLALPALAINYVKIEDGKATLTGRIADQP